MTATKSESGVPCECGSSNEDIREIQAIDIFCGIGGLTRGLRDAGIQVIAGMDIDPTCRYAYEANNPGTKFLEGDVRELKFSDFELDRGTSGPIALVGCAPCQPFSAHTRGIDSTEDCALVDEFARLVSEGCPHLISMENVPGLAKHESFHKLMALLRDLDYQIDFNVLNFQKYGVPQRRWRLVMLASRIGPVALPRPTQNATKVSNFIQDLEPIAAGKTSERDPAHTTLPLSKTNLARIQQSKPGGTWEDWDKQLVSPCHSKARYPASYGRMRWSAPAPTITTQFCYYSTGRFGHPREDRAISVREAALLQTFPSDYMLVDPDDPLPIHKLARHIGNAVPVKVGELIGNSLLEAAFHD